MHIGKIEEILSTSLCPEEYFASFIEQLYHLEVITSDKKQQIVYETMIILKQVMTRYSGGNSSLSKEESQELLNGIQFLISLALKQCTLSNAIALVLQYSINDIYQMGVKIGEESFTMVTSDIANLQANCIDTKVEVYLDTIYEGLSGFLKVYNLTFMAHQKQITADYDTLLPIVHLQGIAFIQQYVQYLQYENTFCKQFSSIKIEALLQRYHHEYSQLIFNISEVVLLEAMGLALLQKDIQTLKISKKDKEKIVQRLQVYSKEALYEILVQVYYEVMQQLLKINKEIHAYFYQCMEHMHSVIYHAIYMGKVEQIFL